jgi:hypothetical protein
VIGVGVSFVLVFLEMQALNQTSVMDSPTASHGVELALLDEDSMNIYNVILGSLGTVRRGGAVMDGLGDRRETSCRSTNCSQKTAALMTKVLRKQAVPRSQRPYLRHRGQSVHIANPAPQLTIG